MLLFTIYKLYIYTIYSEFQNVEFFYWSKYCPVVKHTLIGYSVNLVVGGSSGGIGVAPPYLEFKSNNVIEQSKNR